jgi:hypothetical protein
MNKTENKFNSISVKDLLWFQIKEHLISFRFIGLPKELHYTISFNSESDYNLHITKNTKNEDDKPKISILIIDRELAKSDFESLVFTMIFNLLKPIDIDKLKQATELDFISFSQLENDYSFSEFQKKLLDSFKDISKIKQKTRLKINGNWDETLLASVNSDEMLNLVNNNTSELIGTELKDLEGGMLISDGNVINVIKFFNEWYEFKTDIKPSELFLNIMDKKLVNLIWWKIKRSMIILKNANSYKEVEHLNKPIRLIKSE